MTSILVGIVIGLVIAFSINSKVSVQHTDAVNKAVAPKGE